MPAYIPYSHPSLQIGSVVEPTLLNQFKQLNDLQQQIDTAHDVLNSLIMMKRSLTMTVNELLDMQVNTTPITDKIKDIDGKITAAAVAYMQKRIDNENRIQEVRTEMQKTEVPANTEPIIDFSASTYEARPFAADSLNLDSQFFSFGSNMQDDMIANVEKFVRNSTSQTSGVAEQTAKAVSMQLMNQVQNHSISGTLIIVASCQHRNIGVFNPLVIDTDKTIQVWNKLHPNNKIDPMQNLQEMQDNSADSLSIITGASYGSSFVGMVHILKSDTMQMDDYDKLKTNWDEKIKLGGWLANATGGFGVNEDALKDLRAIISNKSINSHVSIITVGAITSLRANSQVQAMKNSSTVSERTTQATVNSGRNELHQTTQVQADISKQNALMLNIENARVTQIMETAQVLDEKANSTLNINSLMTAFDRYIDIIDKGGIGGSPVNFSTKKLTKGDIIRLLIRKVNPKPE